MSWEVFIQDLPENASTTEEIPEDFVPQPIGARDEIIRKIKEAIPHADFSNIEWGRIEGDGYSIEVAMREENVRSIRLFVRGNEVALPIITLILKTLNQRAIAANTNLIFDDASQVANALKGWQDYRNQIVKD